MPGSKFIERNLGATTAEPFEYLAGLFRILHDQAFGNLKAQPTLRHNATPKNGSNFLNEVRTEQLLLGHFEANKQGIFSARQHLLPMRGTA